VSSRLIDRIEGNLLVHSVTSLNDLNSQETPTAGRLLTLNEFAEGGTRAISAGVNDPVNRDAASIGCPTGLVQLVDAMPFTNGPYAR